MKNIMWLASYPKSGNTWLRVFLTSYILDKRVYINKLYGTPATGSRKLFEFYSNQDSYGLSNDEIDKLRPEIWRRFSADIDEDLVLIKTHDCCHPNKDGNLIFPWDVTKGVIHIVRNPLDVVVSYAFHNGKKVSSMVPEISNINHAMCAENELETKQLRQIIMSWEQHCFSWQSQKINVPMLELRYEDMTNTPEIVFEKIIKFCDLPFDKEKMIRSINSSSMHRMIAQEEKYGFKEKSEKSQKFFRKGVIGDWKNHLNSEEVKEIISNNKQAMKLYGYLDDEDKPIY